MDSSTHADATMRELDAKIRILTTFAHKSYTTKTSSDARRSELRGIGPGLVENALDNDPPFGRMTRTAHLLDSLAQICVSDREIFAVALAVHGNHPTKFELVFAANAGVTPTTIAYLNKLHESLDEFADAVAENDQSPPTRPSPSLAGVCALDSDVRGKLSSPISDATEKFVFCSRLSWSDTLIILTI